MTPCDLPLASARRTWPDKGLIVNFPSAVHLGGADRVRRTAREILGDFGDGRGMALGVIEAIPTNEHLLLLAEETRGWQECRT